MPLKLQRDDEIALNMTPMIDVVFLLLVFFMAATEFSGMEGSIRLDLPSVSGTGALASGPSQRVIAIGQDGTVTLDQAPLTVEQLKAALIAARNEYPGMGVVVRGDGYAPWQRIAEVWSACREAGVTNVSGAVKTAAGPGGVSR